MVTATKEKPKTVAKKTNSQPTRLDAALAKHHELHEACEQLAFSIRDPDDLTISELNVFRQAGIVEREDLNKYMRRCRRAEERVEAAGNKSQFAADKKKLAEAEAVEAKQRPELEKQIEELQAKLDKIGTESTRCRSIVEKRTLARETLLELAPPVFVEEAAHLRRQANERNVQDISWCEQRLRVTDEIRNRKSTDEWSFRHARSLGDDHPCRLHCHSKPQVIDGIRQSFYSIDAAAWANYQRELLANRPKVEKQLADLRAKHDAARERAREPLEYYLKKFDL